MTRKNPKIAMPSKWTSAKIRQNSKGEIQIAVNPSSVKPAKKNAAKGVKAVSLRNPNKRRRKKAATNRERAALAEYGVRYRRRKRK